MTPANFSAATSFVKLLMIVLATLSMVLPSSRVLVASECTNNGWALAYERLTESSCGSIDGATITCPDETCLTNYDGAGAESATCYLDNLIEGNDGVTYKYVTVGGWSPGNALALIPPIMAEGTRIEISGSVQGSVQYMATSANECTLQVNDQDCSCQLVYCNGDQNDIRAQGDCTNLGQGTLNNCDTENYGSPGDILIHYNLVRNLCAQIASGEGSTSS